MDRNWKQEIPSTVSPMIYLLFKPDNYYLICHLNHCQMLGPFIFNMSYSPAGMDQVETNPLQYFSHLLIGTFVEASQ